jgi:hypothetical protein
VRLFFDAPRTAVFRGNSAEWVVEGDEPEANFHIVKFETCSAAKTTGVVVDLEEAQVVNSHCRDGTVCTRQRPRILTRW